MSSEEETIEAIKEAARDICGTLKSKELRIINSKGKIVFVYQYPYPNFLGVEPTLTRN